MVWLSLCVHTKCLMITENEDITFSTTNRGKLIDSLRLGVRSNSSISKVISNFHHWTRYRPNVS